MAYEFTKLSEVHDTETVSDECNVIIEDGGEIKKTAKSNIGKAQVQADWNQTDPTQPDYIKNKLLTDIFLSTDDEGVLISPLILESSTLGSNKKFRISVNDSGVLSTTDEQGNVVSINSLIDAKLGVIENGSY